MTPYSQEQDTTDHPWYAIRTRSKAEQVATQMLRGKGYEPYVPMYRSNRRWSDRVKIIEMPLFPGYIFCRFDAKMRLPILTTPSVTAIVGFGTEPAPLADDEIEGVRRILQSQMFLEPCPFVRVGEKVHIRRGPLNGLEGILLKKKDEFHFVVSVTLLQRSVSVTIHPDWIE